VAYTDANDPAAVALLRQAFELARKIGGLVVDESSRIELKEAMVAGMSQGYETFIRLCNEAISYHITGLRDAQQPAGMNAGQSNFQGSVREDIRMFDQTMLGETCQRGIAAPFREINGLAGDVKFVWGGLSDADAKTFADFLYTMKQAGFQPSEQSLPTVNDRTGLSWERSEAPAQTPADGKQAEEPVFDPNKDVVAQRMLWRQSLKKESAEIADEITVLSSDFITVNGRPVFIGDKKKGSTSGSKNTKIKEQNDTGTSAQSTSQRCKALGKQGACEGRDGQITTRVIGDRASAEPADGRDPAEERDSQTKGLDDLYKKGEAVVPFNSAHEVDGGGEHMVEHNPDDDRAYKHTKDGYGFAMQAEAAPFGTSISLREATPAEWVDRLHGQNEVFGTDARVAGVSKAFSDKTSLVSSQKWIAAGDPDHPNPSKDELDEHMRSLGFQKVDSYAITNKHIEDKTWYHPVSGYVVTDVKPDNFVKDKQGQLVPVDVIVEHAAPGSDLERAVKYGGRKGTANLSVPHNLTWLSASAMRPTPVDDVVSAHSAALAKEFRGSLAPVRQIILSSASRVEAEQKLKLFFADWDPSRIAGIVEEAMQVCAAKGAQKASLEKS